MTQRDDNRDLWWPSPTVERAKVLHLELESPFVCDRGAQLDAIQVSYQSWGELSAAGDNAILLVHPMTADCHAAGLGETEPPGWWQDLVGPGKALDTDTHFVICPNILGGCYGTTGPRFLDAQGSPWLDRFPLLTPRDMMRAQQLFLEQLGIERLRLVAGPSMGGMIAWEWALGGGAEVDAVAVVAAPLVTSAQQIAWNWLQRRGIELDIIGGEESRRFGQMVARGIGMVSYRSPVGLEEKFGREWFKEPGQTLGERGMYNVESWLRHHGKRITKRFCPYTWILYSRAMDLHDVSEGFDGLLPALARVEPRVLVVGISSDELYPAADVHVGADILRHLGKRVSYAEIRSPHGHDAFLLETGQLDRILREWQQRESKTVPTRVEQETRELHVGVVGSPRLAEELARHVATRAPSLAHDHGLRVRVVRASKEDIENSDQSLDALVEAGSDTALLPLVERTLDRGLPVVTTNRALVRAKGSSLEDRALEKGVRFAYHASIAAGWPGLYAVERLLEDNAFATLEAVLSASSNHMLEKMETGCSYARALESAQKAGLTETDPALDTSGWDAAQKLLLLIARAEGRRYRLEDLDHEGLDGLDPRLVSAAPGLGLRVKLVGLLRRREGSLEGTLRPLAVPRDSHLGNVKGSNTIVVLAQREVGEVVHVGPSSAPLPETNALLSDLVGLFDLSQSWTGRFPRAREPLPAARFERFLHLTDQGVEISNDPAGLPLLAPPL